MSSGFPLRKSAIKSADARTPHDVIHWESGNQWAVRRGNWKLVATGAKKKPSVDFFLSDMSKDTTETQNLAEKHPEIVKELAGLHTAWREEVGR